MAKNQFFQRFCINLFGMGPLHYYSSRSAFGKFDIPIWKTTPRINDTGSRDSAYQWYAGVDSKYALIALVPVD